MAPQGSDRNQGFFLDFCTFKTEYSNRLARAFSGLLLPGIGNAQFSRVRI
jgi:hypothetical protein